MEVRLTPELERELASVAARSNRTPQQVATEALSLGLRRERRFIESVEQGIVSADAGRLIPDEDVLAWLQAQEARIVLKRVEWTADALADLEHISIRLEKERTRQPHVP
jgi:predicted transcriptional regulator